MKENNTFLERHVGITIYVLIDKKRKKNQNRYFFIRLTAGRIEWNIPNPVLSH